jgi:hypothetical protein
VLKIGLTESSLRSGTSSKRSRRKSFVPVLENSIISSQDFKVIKR